MVQKYKTFSAYQVDLHYLDQNNRVEVDAIKWDASVMEEILQHINTLEASAKTKKYKDAWLMYLDYLDISEHFIFGRFCSAEYGTTGELIHADNLQLRPNPKLIREGETEFTYFLIKKIDGLMLLQGNLRLNRSKINEYIEDLGQPIIYKHDLTYIQICTLVDNSFFDSIRALNTVHKLQIEVSSVETLADENEAVKALQQDVEEIRATNVNLEFEAKYQRNGMSRIIPLIQKYKDQRGVTKVVVRGKLAGAEKIIKMDESQEKYSRKVEVDGNNQPLLSSVEDILSSIASQRRTLRG